MAFGLRRHEVDEWKRRVKAGEIAFLTHYWYDNRFPDVKTVTKVGCMNLQKLKRWGSQYGLKPEWIHNDPRFPHFDLMGDTQKEILNHEGLYEHINRFDL
ncbi:MULTISPECIES: hypothetical protein [Pontibacillus]|uniref:YneQ n=1 Tax=Pontibacillus chungwhensis TaxID=265426 RepID=A0ABY8V294_9BACI|nr:hypothetical protein [Pontibacillus chungwhensis]MCD5322802.1 hypothetical protein [Pontibacillus sp. HN14]WIG00072.1 hypothetical protein QNI29_10570 [Pontibacillus chungwhensis]